MLEFLFSNREPRKSFINPTGTGRGLPVSVKDEIYGALADIIKKLE